MAEHRVSNSGNTDPNMANKITQALHWDGYGTSQQQLNNISGNLGLATGFHLYSVLWTPESYTFFVDGSQTWSSTSGISQRSEYLILSSEVNNNNNWAGVIPTGGYGSLATTTTNMTVDYVRIYAVPEPSSAGLLATAAVALLLARARRRAATCRRATGRRR